MALPTYAELLKNIRIAAGMSQVELARKINCDQAVISRFEKGTREPSLEYLSKYADIFNLKIDYLVNGSVNLWDLAKRFDQKISTKCTKYLHDQNSYLREIYPFLLFIKDEKGINYTQNFLKNMGVDSLLYFGPNEKISTHIVFDFIQNLLDSKIITKNNLSKIIKKSQLSESHGIFYEFMTKLENACDIINFWAINSTYYDSLYSYDVKRVFDQIDLIAKIKLDENKLNSLDTKVIEFYSQYRTLYLLELPKLETGNRNKLSIIDKLPVNKIKRGCVRLTDAS